MRLRQIMLNVLGNAIKFSDGGAIVICVTISDQAPAGECLAIRVTDQGIGIPADRIDSLFADFVQADNSTAHTYGGTGLGLAISRKLARLMGGDLRLESAAGRGTKVLLDLPLIRAEAPEPKAEQSTTPVKARPGHILLVDDNAINREIVGAMLRTLGHTVGEAGNGIEAIAAVEQAELAGQPFHAVLMDVRMPLMDGYEATRRIKARAPSSSVPVIGCTANNTPDDQARCHAAGMAQVIAKPVSIMALGEMLGQVLGQGVISDKSPEAADGQMLEATPATDMPTPATGIQGRYRLQKARSLERIAVLMAQGDLSLATLQEMSDLAHKLAGSGGMFADADFGDQAYEFEQEICAHRDHGRANDGREQVDSAFLALTAAA